MLVQLGAAIVHE